MSESPECIGEDMNLGVGDFVEDDFSAVGFGHIALSRNKSSGPMHQVTSISHLSVGFIQIKVLQL
jgi:hypothetical protein